MSELPSRPTARILRADDAALWSDGFAFLQAAKEQAEQVKADSEQWLSSARAVLPSTATVRADRPCVPITARSVSLSFTWLRTTSQTSP